LLSSHGDEPPIGIAIDDRDPRLAAILDEATELTRAESASIMLIDNGREHLCIAAAKGLNEDVVAKVRLRIEEGIAGQTFATGNPAITRGQLPGRDQLGTPQQGWIAASAPVAISGRTVGVLSINTISEYSIPDQNILMPLGRLARDLPAALLAAIDLRQLPPSLQRPALLCLIDRLMSLDEALPTRLAAFAECLRKMIGAGRVRFYLLGTIGGEFNEITPHHGAASGEDGTRAHNRDFLSKVMRQAYPVIQSEAKTNAGKSPVTISYPIRCSNLHGILVVENIGQDSALEEVLSTLEEAIGQLESMISIEEILAVPELNAELHMRISDLESQLDNYPAQDRAQALLALALDLVAAEVAIWIPDLADEPILTPSLTPEARRIQKWALENLETLVGWAQANGANAQGMIARAWDSDAPLGPAPYVAIPNPMGGSVLLAFFDPAEIAEASRQVPSHVVWQVLRRVASLLVGEQEQDPARREPDNDAVSRGHRVFNQPMFSELVNFECMRSRRYGHAFSLIRMQLVQKGRKSDHDPELLLRFLLKTTRQVDMISEIRPGVFVVLFPETGAHREVKERLAAEWRSQHPDIELEAEHGQVSPDGKLDATYQSWIAGDGPTTAAA
jgi:hypothetical protein